MSEQGKMLRDIACRLPCIWKDSFGLYTQYAGCLSARMVKTILEVKRLSDSDAGFDCAELDVVALNRIADKHGLTTFRESEDMDAILPKLWKFLSQYNLSSQVVGSDDWGEFIDYLDHKAEKGL